MKAIKSNKKDVRDATGKLRRYNEIMFAVIATIAVLFIAGSVLVGVGAIVTGIFSANQPAGIKVAKDAKTPKQEKERFEFYRPIIIENSDFILVPLGVKQTDGGSRDLGSGGYSGRGLFFSAAASYKNYNYASGRYENIMFYDNKTGALSLLLDRKAIISSIYYPSNSKGKFIKFLLYAITDKDTNGDGYINGDDETLVYISDMSGKNLKQITPPGTQFLDWNMDEKGTFILISIVKDTNKDKKFDDKDDTTIIKVNALKPEIGQEIIGEDTLKALGDISK